MDPNGSNGTRRGENSVDVADYAFVVAQRGNYVFAFPFCGPCYWISPNGILKDNLRKAREIKEQLDG